jgi:hypothetical protein
MKITDVRYLSNYDVKITFEDGLSGIVDLSDLVEQGIFKTLKDKEQFARIYATDYSIAWSEAFEIDAAALYAEISGKSPQAFFDSNSTISNGTYHGR